MVEGREHENADLKNRVEKAKRYQDAIPIIQEYEIIIQRQKRNILILHTDKGASLNGSKILLTFFYIVKELDKFSRLKKPSLSLHFFKEYAKTIKEVRKKGGKEFKKNFIFFIILEFRTSSV